MRIILHVTGTRGSMFFAPQAGVSALSMRRIIRQHVGRVTDWSRHHGSVGFDRAYDEAASRNPRRPTVADRDGD